MSRARGIVRRSAPIFAVPLVAGGFVVATGSASLAAPATVCQPGAHTVNFVYTGSAQNFAVPGGVTSLDISAAGGSGGNNLAGGGSIGGGLGASLVTTRVPVPVGAKVLHVLVGRAGVDDAVASNGISGTSGGGGSFVYAGSSTVLVAAGGGGGASGWSDSGPSGQGGPGGNGGGGNGGTETPPNFVAPGAGGDVTGDGGVGGGLTGGTAGAHGTDGGAGSGIAPGAGGHNLAGGGLGGAGGVNPGTGVIGGGGGGGGGYSGGGGGATSNGSAFTAGTTVAGGGGGGGSYVIAGSTVGSSAATNRGDGSVTITYTQSCVTATFVTENGTPAPKAQSISVGGVVTRPTNPAIPGATFIGWYTAAHGGTQWDFSKPITASITLYAHWKPFGAPVINPVGPSVNTGASVSGGSGTVDDGFVAALGTLGGIACGGGLIVLRRRR